MICHTCGGELEHLSAMVPLKTGPETVVIIKTLPVMQSANRSEYVIENTVLDSIEAILIGVDRIVDAKCVAAS